MFAGKIGRLGEIECIVAAGRAVSREVETTLDEIRNELETSARTSLLSRIDVCNATLAAIAIGIFSLYEARLQKEFGWVNLDNGY